MGRARESTAVATAGLACAVSLLAACAQVEPERGPARVGFRGIVGGEETNYESWQGVVAVYDGLGVCSGTLIHPEVVLTAGHCVYAPQDGYDYVFDPSGLEIAGGADIYNPDKLIYYGTAAEVEIHPSWTGDINESGVVDLALVRIDTPVDGVETYGVRQSPGGDVGEAGKIVGYGMSSSSASDSYGVHRVGDASVIQVYYDYLEVGDPAGICSGDSGGPFFTEQNGSWVVTGVTSYGTADTCLSTGDAWEANTLTFRQWIHETLLELTGDGLDGGPGDPQDTDGDGECYGDCSDLFYTTCTCDPADPCGWSNDGYCDAECLTVTEEMFDDGSDCGRGDEDDCDCSTPGFESRPAGLLRLIIGAR